MKRLLLASALALAAAASAAPAAAQTGAPIQRTEPATPMSILVHITHGPEHPTRAALGFAVANAALRQGHQVTLFLAGDAVQLMRSSVLENLSGLGTGNLRELHDGIVAAGGRFYLSGGSSHARGLDEAELTGRPVQMAGPDQLVELALEHDRMFTY